MTPEIIGADGLDDLNSYLAGEQAKIDAQMLEELESVLKPDKMPDQIRLQYALKVAEEYLNRRKYMGTSKWFEPGTEFGIEVCKKHKLFFDATGKYRQVMFRAANRAGKAQPVTEPVATPAGFVPIGELSVGDEVLGSDGNPTTVTGVFPQGLRPVYKITLSDGSSTECDEDHLWYVRNTLDGKASAFEVLTTKQIKESGKKYALPFRNAAQHYVKELPIDPYLLGLLIGDGGTSTGAVYITSIDKEIIDYCANIAGDYDCELRNRGKITYQFATKKLNGFHGNSFNQLADFIYGLGLKCTSHDKHIPKEYLFASEEQRLALLQGLMDTDGTCGKNGHASFNSVSEQLANDVAMLIRGLGGSCSVNTRIGKYNNEPHISYAVHLWSTDKFIPFRLARKVERFKLNGRKTPVTITGIDFIGHKECVCISVENKDRLYLTKDYIVTHNTIAGAFAVATWLDGMYPDWWEGKRFQKPTRIWAAGKTGQTVRDTVQKELLGDLGHFGTGMIPKDRIAKVIMKPGVPGGVDSIQVYNDWGDASICGFKSYDQRIDAFVGVALDAAWEDEEPPYMVHNETFARLTTTMGVLINTVTPITGLTPYLLNFEKQSDMLGGAERTVALNEDEQREFEKNPRTKCIVAAGWSDAPWLDEQAKIDLLADTPPHLKESRMTGKPSLGSGSVYPVPLESVLIDNDDFTQKPYYKYLYAIDVGWNKTAITWGALDPDTDTLYIYDEYYMGEQRPEVHAVAVKAHGAWMPGVIDPASRGRSQVDGNKLITLYIQSGLQIAPANNAVEAGIMDVYQRLSSGKLKILKKCRNLQAEYMTYKRDINGKVIKENDHLMDTVRYMVVELHRARSKPNNTSIGSGNGARNFFR